MMGVRRCFKYYNPNPEGKSVGDCVIRALSKALDRSWKDIYLALTIQGYMMGDWGNANSVWGAYLKHKGFHKYPILDTCPDCYTVRDFCRDYAVGTFILGTGDHVVAVVDGDYYDAWDSGNEVPVYYFKLESRPNEVRRS